MSYIATTSAQKEAMLAVCGVSSLEELFSDIPKELRCAPLALNSGKSELEVLAALGGLASQNYSHLINFIGGGFYDHFIPAAVDAIAGRSEFYTWIVAQILDDRATVGVGVCLFDLVV